jgi:FAD-NAD(P)-binding protein
VTATLNTIAIVGLGPKGLFALDTLCEAARGTPAQVFDVHIFEPSPYPGAGPIYDPDQPDILLMNFPAQMIDAWTNLRGLDLIAWLKGHGKSVSADDYVPRAEVCRYLAWCFRKVTSSAPPNVHLMIHPVQVTGLRKMAGGWIICPNGVAADEVLVTTGHQDWSRSEQGSNEHLIPSPFPIDRALTIDAVPPGASVACKGFALTFIDTMLALTEGRGGVFTESDMCGTYHPSGDEPRRIAPFSRTGRPMRAKVDAYRFVPPQSDVFWEARIAEFDARLSSSSDATFSDEVWPALLRIADLTLDNTPGTAANLFAEWQGTVFSPERCRKELHFGYEIARGASPPDGIWSLGEAWRRCYPRLVDWISHRELSQTDAARFRTVAAEMERLAFGPPARNVGKLICLERIGLVSLGHLTADPAADITIDATIPPAGRAGMSHPLAALLRDGQAHPQ